MNRLFSRVTRCVPVIALTFVATVCTSQPVSAATVSTWNVGSGQYQNNFLLDSDLNFAGGGLLEIGQRAVFRQSAQLPVVSGSTYDVYPGFQQAGVNGAPSTNVNRNAWNFDYHIYWAGGVQNLDSLTMTITAPSGNTVAFPAFDMKIANNDNVTGSVPWPGGDSQNPAFYIQDSQNPVFAPWFTPTFDMNVTGVYTFVITAIEGNNTLSQTMNINVIPTPGVASIIGSIGLAGLRRRRTT